MLELSIIITSYNYARYIGRCILSCINQKNFRNYEIIVVDDGSNDDTIEILKKYSNEIKFFLNENHGIEYSSNFGVRHAAGKYLLRVDADDILMENCLENLYATIISGDYGFVYSNYYIIDSENNITDYIVLPEFDKLEIMQRGDFLATGTLYLKHLVSYSEKVKNCGLENYELILKLLKFGVKAKHINKPLFYYRHHAGSISNIRKDQIIEYGQILARKFDLLKYQTNKYHPWGLKII
jgi:glycosyltransferase involved in cell wall biosynthesis